MKFLFFGGLWPELKAGLEELGHEACDLRGDGESLFAIDWADVLRQKGLFEGSAELLRRVRLLAPNVIVVFKGFFLPQVRLLPEVVEEFKRQISPRPCLVYWSLDDPYFLETFILSGNLPGHVDPYDIILTCCEGSIPQYNYQLNKGVVHVLYPAFDALLWGAGASESERDQYDFGIVGSVYTKPLNRVALLRAIAARGFSVRVWGPQDQWQGSLSAEEMSAWYGGWLQVSEVVRRGYDLAKVCFNSHITSGYKYLNSRCFEVMGSGNCLLCDEVPGLRDALPWPEAYETYSGLEDAARKAEELIRDEARRKAMASCAREHVLDSHTYKHRARQLVEIVESFWR